MKRHLKNIWTVFKFMIVLHIVLAIGALTASASPILLVPYGVALIIAFWYWDKRKRSPAIAENR